MIFENEMFDWLFKSRCLGFFGDVCIFDNLEGNF